MKEENLIFLVSQPRSGSTLTQKLLGEHTKIHTRSEPWLMINPAYTLKKSGVYTEYNFELEKIAFNSFINDLPEAKGTYIKELNRFYLKLYSYYLRDNECEYYLDKTPRYYFILDELFQIFPRSKYIILLRNPLSVLGSILNSWTKNNWHKLSDFKCDLIYALDVFINQMDSNRKNLMFVKYEDLLEESETQLRAMFNFCDLKFEGDVFKYNEKQGEKWVFGDNVNVYKNDSIDASNHSNWKKGLKNKQYWRVMYDYLEYIGEKKFCRLGYSYDEAMSCLMNEMPAASLGEIKSKTFSLFSFMDNTRECLIDSQARQNIIGVLDRLLKKERVHGYLSSLTEQENEKIQSDIESIIKPSATLNLRDYELIENYKSWFSNTNKKFSEMHDLSKELKFWAEKTEGKLAKEKELSRKYKARAEKAEKALKDKYF